MIAGNYIALKWKKEGGGRDVAAFLCPGYNLRKSTKVGWSAWDAGLIDEEKDINLINKI